MRNSLLLTATAVVFLFYSCDDDMVIPMETAETVLVTDYQPSTIGSYWIYKRFDAMDGENYETSGHLDTIRLTENVNIGGQVYQRFEGLMNEFIFPEYQRDSLNYLVNDRGRRFFSSIEEESETLFSFAQEVYSYDTNMQGDTIIDLAIGLRLAKYVEGFYVFNPDLINVECDQTTLSYWVKDIGAVRMEYFYSSCRRVRHELIEYHIE